MKSNGIMWTFHVKLMTDNKIITFTIFRIIFYLPINLAKNFAHNNDFKNAILTYKPTEKIGVH